MGSVSFKRTYLNFKGHIPCLQCRGTRSYSKNIQSGKLRRIQAFGYFCPFFFCLFAFFDLFDWIMIMLPRGIRIWVFAGRVSAAVSEQTFSLDRTGVLSRLLQRKPRAGTRCCFICSAWDRWITEWIWVEMNLAACNEWMYDAVAIVSRIGHLAVPLI